MTKFSSRSRPRSFNLSLEQGRKLISVARSTIKKSFDKSFNGKFELEELGKTASARKDSEQCEKSGQSKKFKELFERRMGIFVTLHTFPERELRGCIGFVSPMPLWDGVRRAAYAAAFEDPRFPQLSADELGKIIIEISVLTEPTPIKCGPRDYEKSITIGKDGLMLQNGPYSGLFLPQVPKEQGWDAKEFLCNLCCKAGLTPEFLYDKNTELWKFQAQIFAEKEPNGEVEEIKIEN